MRSTIMLIVTLLLTVGCAVNVGNEEGNNDLRSPKISSALSTLVFASNAAVNYSFSNPNPDSAELKGCVSTNATLPANLTLSLTQDKKSCLLGGTVAEPVLKNYTIRAINAFGKAEVEVLFALGLVNPVLANVLETQSIPINNYFSYSMTNTVGTFIQSCSSSPTLPNNLIVEVSSDQRSCVISGVPVVVTNNTNYTITASNQVGSENATINIQTYNPAPDNPPALEDEALAQVATVGDTFTYIFTNSNGNAVTNCSMSPNFPAGLGLALSTHQNNTCKISGIVGQYVPSQLYTITATNSIGNDNATITMAFDLLAPAIDDASAQFTRANVAYSYDFGVGGVTTLLNEQVSAPAGCAITPALTSGLQITRVTSGAGHACRIQGTADVPAVLATAHTVTATNTTSSDNATINLEIGHAAPQLTNATKLTIIKDSIISYSFATTIDAPIDDMINSVATNTTNGCYVSEALPTGLEITRTGSGNVHTCTISGSATTVSAEKTYTVFAKNTVSPSLVTLPPGTETEIDSATIAIEVLNSLPNLLDVASAGTVVVGPFEYIFSQTVSTAIQTCGATPPLPNNLSVGVDTTQTLDTCKISGTAVSPAATTVYTITATSTGGTDTATITFDVISESCPTCEFTGCNFF